MPSNTAAAEVEAPEVPAPAPEAPKPEVPAPGVPDPVKPPEAAKPEAPKPPVFDPTNLKLPENSPLSQARVDKIAAYAKEQGLSQEQAQALLARESEAVSEHQTGLQEAHKQGGSEWTKRIDAYEAAIVSDKEIGGDNAKESAELAKRVVSRFATDELKKQLDATGFGSHPELVRLFVRIGKNMADDVLVHPSKVGSAKKDPARALYDTMEK